MREQEKMYKMRTLKMKDTKSNLSLHFIYNFASFDL